MPNASDWYLNDRWDVAAQRKFFRRLAHKKRGKLRCARLKAERLARTGEAGVKAAIAMLEGVIVGASHDEDFPRCLFALAVFAVALGDVDTAIARGRQILRIERATGGPTYTHPAAELAFLAIRHDRADLFEELLAHLELQRLTWPDPTGYRRYADYDIAYHALKSRLAAGAGRLAEAREQAALALEAEASAASRHWSVSSPMNRLLARPAALAEMERWKTSSPVSLTLARP